jgi:hypothetical protein
MQFLPPPPRGRDLVVLILIALVVFAPQLALWLRRVNYDNTTRSPTFEDWHLLAPTSSAATT